MAKIRKKVQVIADDLQKVDVKVGGSGGGGSHGSSVSGKGGGASGREGYVYSPPKIKGSPAALQVRSVSPLPKNQPGGPKPKTKIKPKKTKGVADVKKEPAKEPVDPEEKRSPGYAGLAKRIAGGVKRATDGARFWWESD